jgi:hypothetical protein
LIDLFYVENLLNYSEQPLEVLLPVTLMKGDLLVFLKTINQVPDDFVAMAKKNTSSVEKMIISFISTQNSRAQRGEIRISYIY